MLRVKQYSISKKLTWMNMMVSGIALLLACVAFFAYDLYTFRASIVRNLSVQTQIIGSNTVSALVFNDTRSAENTLSALKASSHISYAAIYSPDSRYFAGYRRTPDEENLVLPSIPAGQTQAYWFHSRQIDLVSSIIFQEKLVGYVYIRSDLGAIDKRLKSYTLIALGVLLVSLMVALAVSNMARRVISEPVARLANTVRVVSHEKNYSIRAVPTDHRDEISTLIEAFNEMLQQIQERDTALRQAHGELELRVQERTRQLGAANKELEAFAYSVSHDLRAPLRSIDGFSQAILEDYSEKLDDSGKDQLRRVRAATQRMAVLIDDLLNLSRVTRSEMQREKLILGAVAKSVAEELKKTAPERHAEFVIEDGPTVEGDPRLLRVAMENLLGNAWKYTSGHARARIEFGIDRNNGQAVYFVRDDGAGFDPRYAARLFGAFQRLHSAREFPGTGVGLATVQRIIHRHGGEIWAEAEVEKGATFYFTLSGAQERKSGEGKSL
jgi:signal transduction histidine kinase